MQPHRDPVARLAAGTRFQRLVHVTQCESTQQLAQEDREPGCAVYWADHQTSGRGRQGRVWHDAQGKDLAVTFKLAGARLANPALLAPAIPVAALLVLEQASGVRIQLKWPNDLVVSGRKIGGILIDSSGEPPTCLIGVGLNVNRTEFPPELRGTGTSLALATGREFDREELLMQLAVGVDQAITDLERGRLDRLGDVFRARLGLLGKRVALSAGGASRTGRLTALDLESVTLDDGPPVALAIVQSLGAP